MCCDQQQTWNHFNFDYKYAISIDIIIVSMIDKKLIEFKLMDYKFKKREFSAFSIALFGYVCVFVWEQLLLTTETIIDFIIAISVHFTYILLSR